MLHQPAPAILIHALDEEGPAGRFLDANEVACDLLGAPRQRLLSLRPSDLVEPQQQWQIDGLLEEVRLRGRACLELPLRRGDGDLLSAEVDAQLFRLGGQEVVVWILRDLGEARRLGMLEKTFASVAHRLSAASTPLQAAEVVLEAAEEMIGWDAAHVNLYPPDLSGTYSIVTIDTVDGEKRVYPPPPYTTPVTAISRKVLEQGGVLVDATDPSTSQGIDYLKYGQLDQQTLSKLYVPVRKGEHHIGVLSIQSYAPRAYENRDLQTLQVLADQCAGALERTAAEAWMRQHSLLSRKFAELGKSLAEAISPEEVAHVIFSTAQDLFGWDAAFLFFYLEDRDVISPILVYDTIGGVRQRVDAPEKDPTPSALFRKVLESGAELILREPGVRDPLESQLVRAGDVSRRSESLMFAPMRIRDRAVGMISIQSYGYNAYNHEALAQLQALADHCAGALERARVQDSLRASEARLRLVTSQLPALLWTVDRDLRFTLFLGDMAREFGLSDASVPGKPLAAFLPHEAAETIREWHANALRGESGRYEVEWKGLHLDCYVEPLRDSSGDIIGCINVAHDITQRKRAEDALRRASEELERRVEERTRELSHINAQLKQEIADRRKTESELERSLSLLRATLDSTADGIVVVDHQGRIMAHNQQWAELWNSDGTGLPTGEEPARLESLTAPQVRRPGEFRKLLSRSRREREAEFYGSVELHDGRQLEAHSRVQRLGGRSVGRVWSFRDITSRHRAEQKLIESETIYREAIETASGVPYRAFFDRDGYEFMGRGIIELLGIEPSEVRRSTLQEMVVETVVLDDPSMDIAEYEQAFHRGEVDHYRVDLRLRLADGQEKWINDCSVPIRAEETGRVIGSLGILQDITPRKLAEEQNRVRQERLSQAEKLISLGTLVSGVAHEINNPNNFIMLNAPLLREIWRDIEPLLDGYHKENGDFLTGGLSYSQMREHVPELFDGIVKGCERIRDIVRELRDFARPRPDSAMEEIDLNAVVASALVLLQNLIGKSCRQFHVEYATGLPPIMGNFQRLEQVVINLIQNACESLPDPARSIWIRTYRTGGEVLLTVRDEGIGISNDDLKHITDPFFTTKREQGGTGLGLSITSNIVHDHGGVLEFTSHEGRGTTATVRLPAVKTAKLAMEASRAK